MVVTSKHHVVEGSTSVESNRIFLQASNTTDNTFYRILSASSAMVQLRAISRSMQATSGDQMTAKNSNAFVQPTQVQILCLWSIPNL